MKNCDLIKIQFYQKKNDQKRKFTNAPCGIGYEAGVDR